MAISRRTALVWWLGAIIPGFIFAALEFWYRLSHEDSIGDGQLAMVYLFYAFGFLLWSLARLVLHPVTLLVWAVMLFVICLPLGAAFSLGIYALFPFLCTFGGIVATLAFGLRAPRERRTRPSPY